MIDHEAVVETVRAALVSLDASIEENMRWENDAREPPEPDVTYVEESFIPYAEVPIGSGYDRLTGEVRYTVVMPRGTGTGEGRALAGRIKSLFPAGRSLVGKTVVTVDGSEILAGRTKDEARYALPVVVMIRTEALRSGGVGP